MWMERPCNDISMGILATAGRPTEHQRQGTDEQLDSVLLPSQSLHIPLYMCDYLKIST